MKTLQALGWNWRTDGVEVCAQVDGQQHRIFVPLAKVWHEFAKAFAEHGSPLPPAVGGQMTVAGLFGGIAQASVGDIFSDLQNQIRSKVMASAAQKGATAAQLAAVNNAVTQNFNALHNASAFSGLAPIAKAASAITSAALKPVAGAVSTATKALSSVPVFGGALSAATTALTSPVNAVNALVKGGKISSVALNALKQNVSSMRTLAPYAQTVVSLVPGVGQGLSGAVGAGLALASGMSITQAVEAGVRDSLPGGPLARAAFDVATAAAQGRPLSEVALAALPISPQQKVTLVQGVRLARDLASGKNVSSAIVDAALNQLPPDAAKAVQIASALAHAKSLQQAVGTAAQAAGVNSAIANGVAAAQQLVSMHPSAPAPPHLVQAVKTGLQAKQIVQSATNAAAQGHAASQAFLSFLSKPHISGPLPGSHAGFTARFHHNLNHPVFKRSVLPARVSGPHKTFVARIHLNPSHPHAHAIRARVGAPVQHQTFKARFHTAPALPPAGGIHSRFAVAGPWPRGEFSYPSRPVPQLYPARMPYQTAPHLRYAFGR